MKKNVNPFSFSSRLSSQEDSFADRFLHWKFFVLLFFLLFLGALLGAVVAVFGQLFQGRWVFPLSFSGIPVMQSGYAACFSTLLFNALIGLFIVFLLGNTAFGSIAVPFFLFFRGATVGVGVVSYLWKDGLKGVGLSALLYTPAASAMGILLLLFGIRALLFSNQLAKAGFSSQEGRSHVKTYFQDFLLFLSAAAGISLVCSLPAAIGGLFT